MDYVAVKQIIHKIQPVIVVHLASVSSVSYSYDHPQESVESNLLATLNLAEACRHEVQHFRQFLFASTSEIYGNGPNPKTEESPQNPNSPYAVSKVASEKYLTYMKDAYNFPVTTLRNFNTYGRKDNMDFIVERSIVQMLQGKTVRLGDRTPLRDFVYIDDHVNSYLTCLGNEKAIGEIFNFCTGQSVSIAQLVQTISEYIRFKGEIVWDTIPKRPLDITNMTGDYSKAKRLLNWKPTFTLEEGLKLTIDFWKNNLAIADIKNSQNRKQ
jgi:dTDP-glucose 4,6-dehydratase